MKTFAAGVAATGFNVREAEAATPRPPRVLPLLPRQGDLPVQLADGGVDLVAAAVAQLELTEREAAVLLLRGIGGVERARVTLGVGIRHYERL